jgi:hypothetical protein
MDQVPDSGLQCAGKIAPGARGIRAQRYDAPQDGSRLDVPVSVARGVA